MQATTILVRIKTEEGVIDEEKGNKWRRRRRWWVSGWEAR